MKPTSISPTTTACAGQASTRTSSSRRTLSKAYSLAGLRFGYAIGQPQVIDEMMKVKDSYNVDAIAIVAATAAIAGPGIRRARSGSRSSTNAQRVTSELTQIGWKVLPSQANFILAAAPDGRGSEAYLGLKAAGHPGPLLRQAGPERQDPHHRRPEPGKQRAAGRHPSRIAATGKGRLTIQRSAQSTRIDIRYPMAKQPSARTAEISRQTKETRSSSRSTSTAPASPSPETGVGFFDHMLDLLARHSLIDLDRQRRRRSARRSATTPSKTSASSSARRSRKRSATSAASTATAGPSSRWTRPSPRSRSISPAGRRSSSTSRFTSGAHRRLPRRAGRGILQSRSRPTPR